MGGKGNGICPVGYPYHDIDLSAQIVFDSSSSETIARIYLLTHACLPPNDRTTASKMNGEIVLYAFFMYALLRDASNRHTHLKLPHRGENRVRLSDALAARNLRMAGTGQEMWAHACNLCMKRVPGPNGLPSKGPMCSITE